MLHLRHVSLLPGRQVEGGVTRRWRGRRCRFFQHRLLARQAPFIEPFTRLPGGLRRRGHSRQGRIALAPREAAQAPPSSAASRPTSPEPGAGSLAAALTVTPDTYQPLSPSVPETCPEITGGRLSRAPEAEPMLEVSP